MSSISYLTHAHMYCMQDATKHMRYESNDITWYKQPG